MLDNITEDGELDIDTEDEIVDSTLLTHDGTVRNPRDDDGSDGDNEPDDEASGDETTEGTDAA